ncbi:MAG: oligosaccharide flippase family protein [Porphyromonas sp.]|uniref:oligosaccharide flippase family protein n=1 Tax=Porphyromonas sp. TaxID=1924944 RepID=UPI001A45F715|nr:oligosaccharide flippase family protein [Porphyromonas sp.]MBL6453455.1 oligosaccharide flippase family protein [Porphyromonas sp.]
MSPVASPQNLLQRLWSHIKGNKLILENFLSLGLINILNSSFHLIIYPILIRRVGAEAYGEYVYAFSIIAYFTTLVTYGVEMIGTRYIAIYSRDRNWKGKSEITSQIISIRFYLTILSLVVLVPMTLLIGSLAPYRTLLWAIFLSVISYIFMPGWYFIGIQNTRVYLYIQFITKVFLAFAIIFWVIDATDISLYAFLVSINSLIFAGISFCYLIRKEKLSIHLAPPRHCISLVKESTPLFLSNLVITVKSAGLNLVIGNMFGMKSLTGYDFSMRVVTVVTSLVKQLNTALYPSVSTRYSLQRGQKLLRGELLLGLGIMGVMMLLAKPIIRIMGNGPIEPIILPIFTLLTAIIPIWLITGFFIELVLTANKQNKAVLFNQFISLATITLGVIIAVLLDVDIFMFAIIVLVSGLIEILFLYITSKRKSLI